jgi:hypothetical protein
MLQEPASDTNALPGVGRDDGDAALAEQVRVDSDPKLSPSGLGKDVTDISVRSAPPLMEGQRASVDR